ncbi:hypothetical protein ACOMHN_021797 [Nucella lapillus]
MEILGLVDIPLTLVLGLMVLGFIYVYQTWHFNIWRNLGIPGPKPRFFFGNMPVSNQDVLPEFEKWKAQFGKSYGMFFYREPQFVTSDPEVIKEVAVRNFNNFSDRYNWFDGLLGAFESKLVFPSTVPAWRRYRRLVSPSFSAAKLKKFHSDLVQCSKVLADILKDRATKQENTILTE